MNPQIFQNNLGFRPYQSPEDSKTILFGWSGLVTTYFKLKNSISIDVETVNQISRMYTYLSILLHVLNEKLTIEKPQYSVPIWESISKIGTAIADISSNMQCWLMGNELNTVELYNCLFYIKYGLENLCLQYQIRPQTILEIGKDSIKYNLTTIPEPRLRFPVYKKPGRPKKITNKNRIETRQKWGDIYDENVEKHSRIRTKDWDKKDVIDAAWLECFAAICMTAEYEKITDKGGVI